MPYWYIQAQRATDIDVKFTMEVYQLNAGDLTAADTAHDIQSALRLIYKEDDIILHNTQINGTEAAAQSTLTVDDSDKLAKYDLVFLSDGADTDNWYRISSVTNATTIVIFDDLVAEKADNSQVLHVYERRNIGFVFNKSSDDKLYIRITNNSGADNNIRCECSCNCISKRIMKRGLIFERNSMVNPYYSQGLPRIYAQLAPNCVGLYDFSEENRQ